MDKVISVPIDDIKPDPNQPRKTFNQQKLKEMAKSIMTEGLVNPIEIDKNYVIIHGECRWRASRLAGFLTVRTIINPKDLTSFERVLRQCIENAHHSDMNPMESARAWKYLADNAPIVKKRYGPHLDTGATWVSKNVGVKKTVIHVFLALLREPKWVQDHIEKNPKKVWWFAALIPLNQPWKSILQKKIINNEIKNKGEIRFLYNAIKRNPKNAQMILDEYKTDRKEEEVKAIVKFYALPDYQRPLSIPELVLKLEKEMITFEKYMEAMEEILPDLPEQSQRKLAFSLLSIYKKINKLIKKEK